MLRDHSFRQLEPMALGVLIFVLLYASWTPRPQGLATVRLEPGDDIQAAVDSNPEGTTFYLGAGIHRLQSVTPKDSDVFRGEVGTSGQRLTTLSGARLLTSFQRAGPYWVVTGQTQQGEVLGMCLSTQPRCDRPEDFFFDDTPLLHVASLTDLGPGKYFFDYIGQKIYFVDDPTGHKVETSVTRSVFSGPASNVTIQDLIVEKYAAPLSVGAIGDQDSGSGWTVKNNEVRWNHGAGIQPSSGARILGNYIHDNGELGVGGGPADDILMENNEIAYNRNYAGAWRDWECGGAKFGTTNRLTVRRNNVHHNMCAGLWSDVNSINTLYENNRVVENEVGIFYEVSYRAIIRNNVILRNGSVSGEWTHGNVWLWSGQIQLASSQDVEIHGNVVEVDSSNSGNGIALVQQDRHEHDSQYGPVQTVNNYVHHNTITVTGARNHGATGVAQDDVYPDVFAPSSNNRFDFNTYYVYDINRDGYWTWNNLDLTWAQFRAAGQERNGVAYSTFR